jgi:signal transduction histidine kinase
VSGNGTELENARAELDRKQHELERLSAELFDTNRGVLALYAELDQQAERLKRADELKTRFLSNMSHEFRTPLSSILALSRLLLDRVDGELTSEQQRQIGYIQRSAHELLELVNDLLDLAKVEAGKITVRPVEFTVETLFAALRGIMRPVLSTATVELVFEEEAGLPSLYGDEAKVAQILRNFLSNAFKFTPTGEIRVSARFLQAGSVADSHRVAEDSVLWCVADTGIGIAAVDTERIFEEFTQIENPIQSQVTGTGLGLPLCRKLATVLDGRVWVESELGRGSRFYLLLPRIYSGSDPL